MPCWARHGNSILGELRTTKPDFCKSRLPAASQESDLSIGPGHEQIHLDGIN